YLLALARDMASRIGGSPLVAAVQAGSGPEPISPDDPRLVRPADLTNIRAGPTTKGFTLEAPQSFPPGASVIAMLAGAVVAFVFASIFLRLSDLNDPFASPPAWLQFPYLVFFASSVGMGMYASFRLARSLWRGQLRIFLYVKDGVLTVDRVS